MPMCAYSRLVLHRPAVTPTTSTKKPVRFYKTMKSLAAITAAVTVPVHGHLVSGFTQRNIVPMRTQFWEFTKQILRGCAWAAAIAAGMLIYTAFVAKWKEKGFPTIPITALVAMDQAISRGGPGMPGNLGPVIPLGGGGNAQGQRSNHVAAERPRQTSLLDLEDFEG